VLSGVEGPEGAAAVSVYAYPLVWQLFGNAGVAAVAAYDFLKTVGGAWPAGLPLRLSAHTTLLSNTGRGPLFFRGQTSFA
jgi:hypothetical protein